MSLIDELKAKWTCTLVALDNTQNRAAELQIELADLDKAIAALLDPIPQVPAEPSSQASPTEAAGPYQVYADMGAIPQSEADRLNPAPSVPEGFTKWEGGPPPGEACLIVDVIFRSGSRSDGVHIESFDWGRLEHESPTDVIAYRLVTSGEEASELDSQVQAEGDRVALEDLPPISDSDFNALPKFEEGDDWEPIAENVETITIKRDTEFKCSDGEIRQRRVNGEIGYLECDVAIYSWWMNEPKKLSYRFTHMRDWKPQLEWAPYYGLTPPTHHGYRLETRDSNGGQSEYRYVPTDQFIPHEGDDVCLASMDRKELEETLGSAGLKLAEPPPVSELDSQGTPQASIEQSQENPAAEMFGKALAAQSEEQERDRAAAHEMLRRVWPFGIPKAPKLEEV